MIDLVKVRMSESYDEIETNHETPNYTTDVLVQGQRIVEEHRQVLSVVEAKNAGELVVKHTKSETLKTLYNTLSLNDMGLPTFIYSADLIPHDLYAYTPEERNAILQAASIPLNYNEGYPTLPDGETFWSKLSFEPELQYQLFVKYCQLPELNPEAPVRDFSSFGDSMKISAAQLIEYANIFCWRFRAKAYDLFQVATHRKSKEQKARNVEQEHYKIANEFLNESTKTLKVMMANPEDYGVKMRDVVNLMSKMMDIQRLSTNLGTSSGSGAGKSGEDDVPKNASLEVTLRTVARNSGEMAKVIDNNTSIDSLLDDPEALAMAQELIIKMN